MTRDSKTRLTGQIAEAWILCASALDAMMTDEGEKALECVNTAVELLLGVQRQASVLVEEDGSTSAMC